MRAFLLLCSVAALLSTASCHRAKTATDPTATASTAPTATPPLIRFERTPCFGRCPQFVAEISADGALRYEGGANAPKDGKLTGKLNPDVVKAILDQAEEMGFAKYPEDEFGKGMMDAPSAILTIRGHQVKCTGGECPPDLKGLHRYLDQEILRALGEEVE
jgi:Domain of unknown function (DUF6438)